MRVLAAASRRAVGKITIFEAQKGFARSIHRAAYAKLTDGDMQYFSDLLGINGLLSGSAELEHNNTDWMKQYKGQSKVALKPSSTQEVSRVLKYCNDRRLAVVPQAGNSGLCGGSVPLFDEVILLTENLNKVIAFDAVTGALTCQAGCSLGFLSRHVGQQGFNIPLDLGAKQCQAGGFISTNAGGLRLIRYGSLRGSVLGIEAVLADGTVLDLLEPLRKNNTGYDLKQLFIGGEGSLGIVTAASILCPQKPNATHLCFLACPDYAALQKVLVQARIHLGEILSAFEFLDRQALQFTLDQLGDEVKNPAPDVDAPFYALIETAGSNGEHDHAKLEDFLRYLTKEKLVLESRTASETQHIRDLWHFREHISVALSRKGPVYKYDLSLPVAKIYELVEATRCRVRDSHEAEVVAYGHLGDGNVHLNVSVPEKSEVMRNCLEPFVYEFTAAHRGSISAEHGLGQMKNDYLPYSQSEASIQLMAKLKQTFDPRHILNPYKLLPSSYWESL